jgi:hypothetical protein
LLTGVDGSSTFNITAVTMAIDGSSPYTLEAADIEVLFNEKATCVLANVSLSVS